MPRREIVVLVVIAIQAIWRAFANQKQFVSLGGRVELCSLLKKRTADTKKAREQAASKDKKSKEDKSEVEREAALAEKERPKEEAAALELKRLEEVAAEEVAALEKKRLEDEATALEKKRLEEEAAALEKKRLEDEAAALEKKRLEDEAAALEQERLEEEAAALEKKRLDDEAAALEKKRLEEEAAILDLKRLEEEAAALEKKRLEEALKANDFIRQNEMSAATLIQAHLRTFQQRKYFMCNISTAVKLQSAIIMSHEVSSANAITSRWRAFEASKDFTKIQCQIIVAQAICRGHLAQKSLFYHKMAVTKISSVWRCYFAVHTFMELKRAASAISTFIWRVHSLRLHKQLVNSELSKKSQCKSEVVTYTYFSFLCIGVILCQSIARRHSASNEVSQCRHERHVAAASSIQSKWRAFEASKGLSVIRRQSIVFRSIEYHNTHKTAVTEISAVWRRYSAMKRLQNIRSEFFQNY